MMRLNERWKCLAVVVFGKIGFVVIMMTMMTDRHNGIYESDLGTLISGSTNLNKELFQGDVFNLFENMTGYTDEEGEDMVSLGLERTTFIVETSGRGNLSLRQLLGVESAARYLKDLRHLCVILVTEKRNNQTLHKTPIMRDLEERYNGLRFLHATFEDLFRGTLLEKWYEDDAWRASSYRVEHLSDAFRFLTLFTYGGLYLDLDVVVQKWWTLPNNSVFWENGYSIASCVLAFRKGHPFLKNVLLEFSSNYNPNNFVANGPEIVRTYYMKCRSSVDCDVLIFPQYVVSPVVNSDMPQYFSEAHTKDILQRVRNSTALHYSNSITKKEILRKDSESAIASIFKNSSPLVWSEIEKVGWA